MKRILLIRHGESRHNVEGNCLSGITDVPITDYGKAQAIGLSRFLSRFPIDVVYSSPLVRAMDTARLAVPALSGSIQVAKCLLEIDYGTYEGTPANALDESDPIVHQWNHAPGKLCFPSGGCIPHHADLVFKGLTELVAHSPGNTIACFSHRTTIRLIVAKLLGVPLNSFRRVPCANASISVCSNQGQDMKIVSLNLTAEEAGI